MPLPTLKSLSSQFVEATIHKFNERLLDGDLEQGDSRTALSPCR